MCAFWPFWKRFRGNWEMRDRETTNPSLCALVFNVFHQDRSDEIRRYGKGPSNEDQRRKLPTGKIETTVCQTRSWKVSALERWGTNLPSGFPFQPFSFFWSQEMKGSWSKQSLLARNLAKHPEATILYRGYHLLGRQIEVRNFNSRFEPSEKGKADIISRLKGVVIWGKKIHA